MFDRHTNENRVVDIIDGDYALHELYTKNLEEPLDVLVNSLLAYSIADILNCTVFKSRYSEIVDYDVNYNLNWDYIKKKLLTKKSFHPALVKYHPKWQPSADSMLERLQKYDGFEKLFDGVYNGRDLTNTLTADVVHRYKELRLINKCRFFSSELLSAECGIVCDFFIYPNLSSDIVNEYRKREMYNYTRMYKPIKKVSRDNSDSVQRNKEHDIVDGMKDPLKPVSATKLATMREVTLTLDFSDLTEVEKRIIRNEFTDDFLIDVYKSGFVADLYVNIPNAECGLVTSSAYANDSTIHTYKRYTDMINTILINMNYDYTAVFKRYCAVKSSPSGIATYDNVEQFKFAVASYANDGAYDMFVPLRLGFNKISLSSLIKHEGRLL